MICLCLSLCVLRYIMIIVKCLDTYMHMYDSCISCYIMYILSMAVQFAIVNISLKTYVYPCVVLYVHNPKLVNGKWEQ